MIPAIVLAGGLGTRLRTAVPNLPKPMAPVAGRPFLWWVLRRLSQQGVREVYLSAGYLADTIAEAFTSPCFGMTLHIVQEAEPLGTGGAIAATLRQADQPEAFVLNGDTLVMADLPQLLGEYRVRRSDVAMVVARMADVQRYGAVNFQPEQPHRVSAFEEKGRRGAGFINAGVYIVRRDSLLAHDWPERFSFEQDYLNARLCELQVHASPTDSRLIDIGVPEDYVLAQTLVPDMAG